MVAERVNFVASFVSVTVAPGTIAPVVSVTVPRRLPVFWANRGQATSTSTEAIAAWSNPRTFILDIGKPLKKVVLFKTLDRALSRTF